MLEGVTAIVTGASRGLGKETAKVFANEGANVTLAARSEGIYTSQEEIKTPESTLAIQMDVSIEKDIQETVNKTVDAFGGLDCVVNNAAIAGPTAPTEEIHQQDWEKTLAVNITGPFLLVKHAIPYLRESPQARVINISSVTGKRPLPDRTPYAVSKLGLIALTRTWAFELGNDNVTVNTLCPGAMDTTRLRRVFENHAKEMGISYEEALERIVTGDQAIDEILDPKEVANLIAFLASKNGRHITGQDINIDSGLIWY